MIKNVETTTEECSFGSFQTFTQNSHKKENNEALTVKMRLCHQIFTLSNSKIGFDVITNPS